MRLNLFGHSLAPEPDQPPNAQPSAALAAQAHPSGRKTFPADEIAWGIVIRNGFDEMDDPWYHRGTTQHAYLEGNDNVAICGFRPPQSGPRTRRRARLGMPTPGIHPMCGMCARMVVAPRPRVPVPVQSARPAVAVPVTRGGPQPAPARVPVTPRAAVAAGAPAGSPAGRRPAGPPPGSPQPQQAAGPVDSSRDGGLLARGVHADVEG